MSLVEFCEKGDLDGVKAALKRGDDVNTKDPRIDLMVLVRQG